MAERTLEVWCFEARAGVLSCRCAYDKAVAASAASAAATVTGRVNGGA